MSLASLVPVNLSAAFYSFEIWDPTGCYVLSGVQFGTTGSLKAQVTLRLPPQSLSIERPFRADMGVDLAGNPTIVEAGFGPGRWSLRGVYGVGVNGLRSDGLVAPSTRGEASEGVGALVTVGLATRTDVQNLFLAYASVNKERLQSNLAPYRMVFAVRGGPPSEFQNEEWWILPMGLPTDERSAGRPHDWAFSVTFWALARVSSQYARPINLGTMKSLVAAIQAGIASTLAAVNGVNASITGVVQGFRDGISVVTSAALAASSLRTMAVNDVKNVCGLLDQAAFTITTMRTTLNNSTLRSDVASVLHASLTDLRVSVGKTLLALRTNVSSQTIQAVLPPKLPVVNGQDIRRMAAATFGDESKWTLIADKNGLVFPFVAWPDASGNMPIPALIPGTVAGLGTAVQPPSLAATDVPVADPVGTDIDPLGAVDANQHLVLIGGLANLRNALARRLQTPRGYLPQHPEYGSLLASFLGGPMDIPALLAIRSDVSRTLLQDPRVRSVPAVTVNAGPTTGSVVITATVQTVLGSLSVSTPALTS